MNTFVRAAEPDMVGQVIDGKYEVLSTLGRGGMAVVYETRDLTLHRTGGGEDLAR